MRIKYLIKWIIPYHSHKEERPTQSDFTLLFLAFVSESKWESVKQTRVGLFVGYTTFTYVLINWGGDWYAAALIHRVGKRLPT